MTNGLTSADSWKFIFYHELAKGADPHPKWAAELPERGGSHRVLASS